MHEVVSRRVCVCLPFTSFSFLCVAFSSQALLVSGSPGSIMSTSTQEYSDVALQVMCIDEADVLFRLRPSDWQCLRNFAAATPSGIPRRYLSGGGSCTQRVLGTRSTHTLAHKLRKRTWRLSLLPPGSLVHATAASWVSRSSASNRGIYTAPIDTGSLRLAVSIGQTLAHVCFGCHP